MRVTGKGPARHPSRPAPAAPAVRQEAPASVAQLIERARALMRAKDHDSAEAVFQRLMRAAPEHRDVLRAYGLFKLHNNDPESACDLLGRCLRQGEDDGVALKYLGLAHLRKARFQEAVQALEKAAAALPRDADVHFFLSQAYGSLKRYDDGLRAAGRALEINGRSPAYLNAMAALFSNKGQDRRAVPLLHHALDLSPEHWAARLTLAHVLMRLGRHAEALSHYQEVMRDAPDRLDALTGMGNAYVATDQLQRAEELFARLIELHPNDASVHQHLGNLAVRKGELDAAMRHYCRALELRPEFAEVHNNYGITLRRFNRVEESLAELDLAVRHKPDFPDAHWNRSLSLLLLGRLAEGFEEYDWRWRGGVRELRPRRLPGAPWKRGDSLRGKSIFIHSEQGLGDHIQFVRYLPRLLEMGASRVYAEFPQPLVDLCRFNMPGIDWVERGTNVLPAFDLVCPLLSLPQRFGTTLESIPAPDAYLQVPAPRAQHFRELLGTGGALRVGLVWSGNPRHSNDRNRSMSLQEMLQHLPAEGVEYVSLMKEARPADLEFLRASGRVRDLSGEIESFVDTAGLIHALDLVLCVDTSVAHLAGALGRPVWVLVPFAPDWRWMLDRSDTPWYRSMTLFRQDASQAWEPVLRRVGGLLAQRVRG